MVETPKDRDREALTAELALGLLDGAERTEALRLCLSDRDFAQQVEQWSARLSPMLSTVPPAQPSARVWEAIAARIGAPAPAASGRLLVWRTAALAAGALAACLALVVAMRPETVTPDTSVVVSQMTDASGGAMMAVAYDPHRGVLRFDAHPPNEGGKRPELWVIPEDGAPQSLGLLASGNAEIAIANSARHFLKSGATLAITMEDPATAPHKAPSAAPVMTGKISEI
ncbi:anti-sigma factor domain-containing protein [Novosphingobium sp. TCA1]|uniref:Anti-sigma K factor RskA C-terminal domain-containing protein n=1 Tax=Novosphingobium pentaromativorans TaxID=205844 RepID=A0A2W5NED1_9SPHN|nr:anti-sigma factor [Novosphingobium sp. TCA1]PZQ51832.1 MAG: hypothetical protein DI555_20760 [Novosphingobium pentaromativorans]GFE76914.1 hypothetical protein NTCA1_45630 [Novosphingobium sp. TCA1]